jgi:hypothetical protein
MAIDLNNANVVYVGTQSVVLQLQAFASTLTDGQTQASEAN